jgi:hypothetical protein
MKVRSFRMIGIITEDFNDELDVTVSKATRVPEQKFAGLNRTFRKRKNILEEANAQFFRSFERETCDIGKPEPDYNVKESSSLKHWNISALWTGCNLVITVIFLVLFVVFRRRIDYRIYRIRQSLKRRKHLRRPGERSLMEEKHYDVYLSYAESDYPWVLNHLLPHIESGNYNEDKTFKGKFKMYLSDRDAQPGRRELDTMCESIQRSRTSLVVLSRNYKHKPLHAVELENMLMCKENLVIKDIVLIMTEELDFEQIPEVLHSQIRKEKVLRWENDETKERVFIKDLIKALS